MKKFRLFVAGMGLFASTNLLSQNVGIGTNAPTERLHVNGNVNVQGQLKVNGNAGRPGQVLSVNNDGTQSWTNMFSYKNRKIFLNSTNWTVPAGVREIMIEAVGGGGGGAKGGGGASGSYGIVRARVVPGSLINIEITAGGNGSETELSSGATGGSAIVRSQDFDVNLIVAGGNGANPTTAGIFGGGYLASGDSIFYEKCIFGVPGEPTVESYQQRTATEFVTIRKYGNGAPSPYAPQLVQQGTYFSFNTVTLSNVTLNFGGGSGPFGCGGAGGNTSSATWGYKGGIAMVAISW